MKQICSQTFIENVNYIFPPTRVLSVVLHVTSGRKQDINFFIKIYDFYQTW